MKNTIVISENNRDTKSILKKIWNFLLLARYFLPILSTIGYILTNCGAECRELIGWFYIIGVASTLLTAPLKIFKFSAVFVGTVAAFAMKITCIFGPVSLLIALIAGMFAVVGCLLALLHFPIVFTMYKFFFDSKYIARKEKKSKIVA